MRKSRTTSMRLNLKLLLSGLLLVLLAFCSSVSFAASPADTLKQEPTINVPLSSWNELKGRLMIAENSINSSKQALQQANSLTATQGDELSRLKTINKKQGEELEKASQITTEQANSLSELKEQIKRNKRTEQRLKRQRTIWGVVAGVVTVLAAVK